MEVYKQKSIVLPMKRSQRQGDHATGFIRVLKEALEVLGYGCFTENAKLVIESAPLFQEVPEKRITKVVKAYETLYYNLAAADLALSSNPLVDKLLEEVGKAEIKEFAERIRRNPGILLKEVKRDHRIPAKVVEALHNFLLEGCEEELSLELTAYLGE
jgi:hypothetical protein